MKKTAIIAIAGLATVASADVLLNVDLSVANTITITATGGLSAADVSGSDGIGVLLENFFNDASFTSADTFVSGDLTAANDSSDGTPDLFSSSTSFGLNFWSWTNDSPSTFTAGALAFSGSATWSIDAANYTAMLAGNLSGDIGAYADTDDDSSTIIGTWNVVPAPSAMALLGLGGIVAGRRRR